MILHQRKGAVLIARAMLSSGLMSNNFNAQQFAQDVVGNPTAENILDSFGVADITPVGAIFAIQEALRDVERLNNADAKATAYIVPGLVTALSVLEAVPPQKLQPSHWYVQYVGQRASKGEDS